MIATASSVISATPASQSCMTTPGLSTGSTAEERSLISGTTEATTTGPEKGQTEPKKSKKGKLFKNSFRKLRSQKEQDWTIATSTPLPSATSLRVAVAVPRSELPIPLPQVDTVDAEVQSSAEHASVLQEQSSFWRRVIWDHHDKERLEQMTNSLRDEINQLDSILLLKSPAIAAATLAPSQKTFQHTLVQESLKKLHDTFTNIAQSGNGQSMSNLSIYIAESPIENWKMLKEDASYVPSASDKEGLVFCIQIRQTDSGSTKGTATAQDSSQSMLALVEVDKFQEDQAAGPQARALINCSHISSFTANLNANGSESYAAVGLISIPTKPTTKHLVYRDRTPWSRECSLAEWMSDDGFRQNLHISHVVQLAFTIVQAYLDFALVRPSCSPMRLQSLEYYRRDGQANDTTDGHKPMLLPYLSFGFGRGASKKTLGATRTARSDHDVSMVELGILLFQLGGHQLVDYKSTVAIADPVLAAREAARNNLRKVESHSTPRFAEIVRILLDYQDADVVKQTETIERILNALSELERDLNKAVL